MVWWVNRSSSLAAWASTVFGAYSSSADVPDAVQPPGDAADAGIEPFAALLPRPRNIM